MIIIKSPAEIEKLRSACKISAEVLKYAGEQINAGMSTLELDKLIYDFITVRGAKPSFLGLYGFKGSACISLNDQVIHGIPSKNTIIRNGDIVSIDVGAAIGGYHGDNAYTFMVGAVSPATQKLLKVTNECLHLGIAAAQPGARVGDIGYAVQEHAEQNGFSVVREYVGHGVGRNLHEEPEVPNYGTKGRGARLLPGMTIAIEPMINEGTAAVKVLPDGWTVKTKDGMMSAHFEHTIAITTNGPVILTT
ncbi:MAG: type I methionyl aminopeptidase, partial [Oscillospiraceae bacterium]